MNVIEATNIQKSYGEIEALSGVDLSITKGKITGIFGPNGAGKTTLLKVLMGLVKPDQGDITAQVSEFAYIPENLSLYPHENVRIIIGYIIALKGINKKKGWEDVERWVEKLGIRDLYNQKISELSKGQAKKVMFLIMLIGNPDFFVLDEPFTGLDVESAEHLRQIVLDKRRANKTILFSTHILEHAEQMCDSAVFIKKGKILERGDIHSLKKKYTQNNWKVSFYKDFNLGKFPHSLKEKIIKISNTELELSAELASKDIMGIMQNQVNVRKIERNEPSLKEIYLTIMGKSNERNI